MTGTTLGDVLAEQRRSRPARTAVVDGRVRLTYAELDGRVNATARMLDAAGVAAGDVVAWYGQNSFRVLELLLASARLGAALCPMNWRSSRDEAAFVLDDLTPKVVVWQQSELEETAAALQADSSATWIRHDGDCEEDYEGRVRRAPTADFSTPVEASAPVLLLYTAAFEGRPAAAELSQEALLHQAMVMALAARIDETAVYLNCGPLFHIATWMWALPTFLMGGTNVYLPRADPERICTTIEAERVTGAFLPPPTVEAIVALNAEGSYDLSSLRAPAGSEEWNRMITVDTSPMASRRGGFGQTEVVGLATFAAFAPTGTGGAGRPGPMTQVRVVDPDGADVAPGEVGEIVVRGPAVASGYRNRPELTVHRRRDGWHRTHDLGRREDDGSLVFVGPMTRIVKTGAENVYPAEVEQCIRSHPAVADCAVIGIPDDAWGQRVKAVVVPVAPGAVDPQAIVEHCRARIASYKKPSVVVFVDALPRVDGRIDYDALDAEHGGGGYPGAGS
jgi:long-chain acyl-CoA synthetase